MNTKSYKIVFEDNTGPRAIDAIATTVQGNWSNTVSNYDGQGHDIGLIEVDADNADYLVEILHSDDNVISFEEVVNF